MIMKEEIWKKCYLDSRYEVSNLGGWRRLMKNGKYIYPKGHLNAGYRQVSIGSRKRSYGFHRIIATAFIPNPNNYPQINHIDSNRANNSLDNLEWVTIQQNQAHKVSKGRQVKGETANFTKLTEKEVLEIRELVTKGYTDTEISTIYDTTNRNIWCIRKGISWKHVLPENADWKEMNKRTGNVKLNAEQVIEIRKLYKTGLTQKQIGIKLSIPKSTVCQVLSGKTWKHLKQPEDSVEETPDA